jgi:RNA polymerase sigma factor (sigma-70 family)
MADELRSERERRLVREGEALRALARCLVRAEDVEDLVQSTHAIALAAKDSVIGHLTPWLRVTLRNLARGTRRAAVRRHVREQVAVEVPDVHALDPARLAMQAELVRDLGAAVHGLEEPFRTVVVMRFWHGLLPEAIAEQLGVPRNTIRSRLQRGLERLREALDDREGGRGAWFPAALGLGTAPLSPSPGSWLGLSWLGWIMQGKLLGLAAFAVLGLMVVPWWLQSAVPVAVRETAQNQANAEVLVPPNETASPAASRDAVVPAPSAPASTVPGGVVVRGRCVDEDGGAVAGATILLRPVSDLPVAVEDAKCTANSDSAGQFEIAFLPVARSYELLARSERMVPVRCAWQELVPGSVLELGNLVLLAGGLVAGRVVDTAGRPQAGIALGLRRLHGADHDASAVADETLPQPPSCIDLWSQADGTFLTPESMAPGDWSAMVMFPHYSGALAGERANCHVVAGATTSGVDLVCADITARVVGQVVDRQGRGLAGAMLGRAGDLFPLTMQADEQGRFGWPRPAGDASNSIRLRVRVKGFEPLVTAPLPWGEQNARIEIDTSPEVLLEVWQKTQGVPLAAFGLRLCPGSGAGQDAWAAVRLALPVVPRPQGTVVLRGLPRGNHAVWVEPDVAGVAAFVATFPVDAGTTRARLLAPDEGQRRVRVIDADGHALVGTAVELVQTMGDEVVTLSTRAVPVAEFDGTSPVRRQLVSTDQDGAAELRAGMGSAYTVRVLGPGHRPVVVSDVWFEPGLAPLVVTVDVGGSLVGVLEPPEVLAQLGPDATEVAAVRGLGERGATMLQGWMPKLILRAPGRGAGDSSRVVEGVVQSDGSFRIDGVPSGTWEVSLRHRLPGIARSASGNLVTHLATVQDLQGGEERRLLLHADSLACGSLQAVVLVDGVPLADSKVNLLYRRAGLVMGDREMAEATVPAHTDALGAVAVQVPPGDYAVEARVANGKGGEARSRSEQVVTVVPGQQTVATFALLRRTLRVRILRPDGSPEVGRKFSVLQASYFASAGSTDAEGWIELDSVPSGAFDLVTWPVELATVGAQSAYIKAHPYPQWLDGLVRIGPVEMSAGQARAQVVLRLPQ